MLNVASGVIHALLARSIYTTTQYSVFNQEFIKLKIKIFMGGMPPDP